MSSEEIKEKALKMIRQEAEVQDVEWNEDVDGIADIMVKFHEEMKEQPEYPYAKRGFPFLWGGDK